PRPAPPVFPYTTLFRSHPGGAGGARSGDRTGLARERGEGFGRLGAGGAPATPRPGAERIDPKRRRPVRTSAEGRVDVGSAGHLRDRKSTRLNSSHEWSS